MTIYDPAYFARRALEEDDAAQRAACPEAKLCHDRMAEAYRQRCMETLPAGMKDHMAVTARADHPKRRQPIVSSNMPVLTPSPIMAASPLRRA
jgi:hypothetical protein